MKISISGQGAEEFANELAAFLTQRGTNDSVTLNVRKPRSKKTDGPLDVPLELEPSVEPVSGTE